MSIAVSRNKTLQYPPLGFVQPAPMYFWAFNYIQCHAKTLGSYARGNWGFSITFDIIGLFFALHPVWWVSKFSVWKMARASAELVMSIFLLLLQSWLTEMGYPVEKTQTWNPFRYPVFLIHTTAVSLVLWRSIPFSILALIDSFSTRIKPNAYINLRFFKIAIH